MSCTKRIVVLFFMTLMIILCSNNIIYAKSSYKAWTDANNIDSTKKWVIKFDAKLKLSSVNESNIQVVDESNNKIPINVKLNGDYQSVTVSPKNANYKEGQTYYLLISGNIQKSSGRELRDPVKMKFVIKNKKPEQPVKPKVPSTFRIGINAGRGGEDTGIVGPTGLKEKDLNLSIALKVGNILKNNGIDVVYTRQDDNVNWSKDSVTERAKILNEGKADYVVSINGNTAGNSNAEGVEVYYSEGNQIEKNLANHIQNEVVKATGIRDRGTKPGKMPELNMVNVPSVKLYLGFLNNPNEESNLSNEEFKDKYAQAIATGIMNFKKSPNTSNTGNSNSSGSSSSGNIGAAESISSVKDIIANVTVGQAYSLPTTVSAIMKNGKTENKNISWDSTAVDTSKAGTYAYVGTVSGYSKKVLLTLMVTVKGDNRSVIVIDPGHGGYDSGAVGASGTSEKDVTLKVGLKLGAILESKGIKVVYTRTSDKVSWPSDESQDLQKRCDIANSVNANYYLSIHCNSADVAQAHGIETFASDSSPLGKKLAENVQSNLVKDLGALDRGVKSGDWLYVVKHTNAPTILTELGFLSNPTEEKNLRDDSYENKVANAISKGILKTLGK